MLCWAWDHTFSGPRFGKLISHVQSRIQGRKIGLFKIDAEGT